MSKLDFQWDGAGQIHYVYSVSLSDQFLRLLKFDSKWSRKLEISLLLFMVQAKWEVFQFIMDFVSNGPHLHLFFNMSQNFGGYISWQNSFKDSCTLVHWEFFS